GFKQRLTAAERSDEWERLIVQRKLVESFISERFHDEQGRNVRAYHTYAEPVSFASRLKVRLREVIDKCCPPMSGSTAAGSSRNWEGRPGRVPDDAERWPIRSVPASRPGARPHAGGLRRSIVENSGRTV